MACRKAAYRALTELSEWKEQEQEKEDQRRRALNEELQKQWTPKELYEQSCPLWLADGPQVDQSATSLSSISKGCNGACGSHHPRIFLEYDSAKEISRASLSLPLDPFIKYFKKLEEQGLAQKSSRIPNDYQLKGFLQDYVTQLQDSFGHHMIRVTPESLRASHIAHIRYLADKQEQQERESKRPRLANASPATEGNSFQQAMQICHDNGLREYLDIMDFAWMRLTGSPIMTQFASRMIRHCLRNNVHLYMTLTHSVPAPPPEGSSDSTTTSRWVHIVLLSHVRIPFQSHDTELGAYVPQRDTSLRMPENDCDRGRYKIEICMDRKVLGWAAKEDGFLKVGEAYLENFGADNTSYTTDHLTYEVRRSGDSRFLCIHQVHFRFSELLRFFLHFHFPKAKQNWKERNVSSIREKLYVRALAKEARNFRSGQPLPTLQKWSD